MTITSAVYEFFDSLPECLISGWQLFDNMLSITGKRTYPTTLLSMARTYADITGAEFYCVDPGRSLYKFIPGIKLGNAIIDNREEL